jgi:hypothetical protein
MDLIDSPRPQERGLSVAPNLLQAPHGVRALHEGVPLG